MLKKSPVATSGSFWGRDTRLFAEKSCANLGIQTRTAPPVYRRADFFNTLDPFCERLNAVFSRYTPRTGASSPCAAVGLAVHAEGEGHLCEAFVQVLARHGALDGHEPIITTV